MKRSREFATQNASGSIESSPVADKISRSANQKQLSFEEMSKHYNECLKMAAENKITSRNAFSLRLIEYIPIFLKDDKIDSFQMASSSLDAGSKIYSHRVDALYDDTYQVLNCLGRTIQKSMRVARSPEETDDNEEEASLMRPPPNQPSRSKRKKPKHMTVPDKKKIRLKSLPEREDPMYQRITAKHDEGSSLHLLLNQIGTLGYPSELLCDQINTRLHVFSLPPPDPFDSTRRLVEYERQAMKIEESLAESVVYYLLRLLRDAGRECIPREISPAVTICAELEQLQFMAWTPFTQFADDFDNLDTFASQMSTMDLVNSSALPDRNPQARFNVNNDRIHDSELSENLWNFDVDSRSRSLSHTIDLVSNDEMYADEDDLVDDIEPKNFLDMLKHHIDTSGSEKTDAFGDWKMMASPIQYCRFRNGLGDIKSPLQACVQNNGKQRRSLNRTLKVDSTNVNEANLQSPPKKQLEQHKHRSLKYNEVLILDSPAVDPSDNVALPEMDYVYSVAPLTPGINSSNLKVSAEEKKNVLHVSVPMPHLNNSDDPPTEPGHLSPNAPTISHVTDEYASEDNLSDVEITLLECSSSWVQPGMLKQEQSYLTPPGTPSYMEEIDMPQLTSTESEIVTSPSSHQDYASSSYYISRDIDDHEPSIIPPADSDDDNGPSISSITWAGKRAKRPTVFCVKKEKFADEPIAMETNGKPSPSSHEVIPVKCEMKMESTNSRENKCSERKRRRASQQAPIYISLCAFSDIKESVYHQEDNDVIVTSVTPKRTIIPMQLLESPRPVSRMSIPYVRVAKRVTLSNLTRVMRHCLDELIAMARNTPSSSNSQDHGFILFSHLVDLMLKKMPPRLAGELSASLIYYTLLHITNNDLTLSISTFEDQSDIRICYHVTPETDPDYIRLMQYAAQHGCSSDEATMKKFLTVSTPKTTFKRPLKHKLSRPGASRSLKKSAVVDIDEPHNHYLELGD